MKKIPSILAIVLLISTQYFCGLPALPSSPVESSQTASACPKDITSGSFTPEPEIVGTINLVNSQVETGRADNLQPLTGLQDFVNGDSVRVTLGGKGKLSFNDGVDVTLFNEAEVTDVKVTIEPPAIEMDLIRQGFRGKVNPGCTLIVDVPNGGRITILGTTFFVVYDPVTQVAIAGNFDGSVRYTPPNGAEQVLTPGQMVNIPSQGDVVLMPLPFTPEQFDGAVDSAGTPTAGLSVLQAEYQIQPLPSPLAPVIEKIEFPSNVIGDNRENKMYIHFHDENGDVNHFTLDNIAEGRTYRVFDEDPSPNLIEGDSFAGVYYYIYFCTASSDVPVQATATLYDKMGLKSNSFEFSFVCEAP